MLSIPWTFIGEFCLQRPSILPKIETIKPVLNLAILLPIYKLFFRLFLGQTKSVVSFHDRNLNPMFGSNNNEGGECLKQLGIRHLVPTCANSIRWPNSDLKLSMSHINTPELEHLTRLLSLGLYKTCCFVWQYCTTQINLSFFQNGKLSTICVFVKTTETVSSIWSKTTFKHFPNPGSERKKKERERENGNNSCHYRLPA